MQALPVKPTTTPPSRKEEAPDLQDARFATVMATLLPFQAPAAPLPAPGPVAPMSPEPPRGVEARTEAARAPERPAEAPEKGPEAPKDPAEPPVKAGPAKAEAGPDAPKAPAGTADPGEAEAPTPMPRLRGPQAAGPVPTLPAEGKVEGQAPAPAAGTPAASLPAVAGAETRSPGQEAPGTSLPQPSAPKGKGEEALKPEGLKPGPTDLPPNKAEGIRTEGAHLEAPRIEAPRGTGTPTLGPTPTPQAAPIATPATAAGTPSSSAPASPAARQVEVTLRWMVKGAVPEARLQLQPESLGKVSIELKVAGGEVHAKVWVQEANALQALQEGRAALEQALKDSGLQLGSFDLQQGGQAAHQQADHGPQGSPGFPPEPTPLRTARQEAPEPAPTRPGNPRRIELYA